jgi:alginate O-acetyltransferase complex protein AlgJ
MPPPRQATETRRPGAMAMIVVFLVVITAPGLGLALRIEHQTISESEMRELATWPAWSWAPERIAAWPSAFQKYFDDHFLLRNRLITWRASLLWNRLHVTASDTVIAGKDGWLFYGADGGVDDWIQTDPFTQEELELWRQALVRRRAFLAKRAIPYLFIIAPDKQMIYPEFMPDTLRRMRPDFRADQLIAYMRETTPDFKILDLRAALGAAKHEELLYHRSDSHWNDRGALVAYQTIVRALQEWFSSMKPLQRSDFDTDPTVPSGDRISMLGLTDQGKAGLPGLVLRGQGHRIVVPEHPDPYGEVGLLITEHHNHALPKAMVYRDSFGGQLIPLLSEHFSRASYRWQNEFEFEEIDREKPDVVIQEFVARHLFTYLPYPPMIPD